MKIISPGTRRGGLHIGHDVEVSGRADRSDVVAEGPG
jgi:hypothetical protein